MLTNLYIHHNSQCSDQENLLLKTDSRCKNKLWLTRIDKRYSRWDKNVQDNKGCKEIGKKKEALLTGEFKIQTQTYLSNKVHVLSLAVSLMLCRCGGRCGCFQGLYELLQLLLLTLNEVKLCLQPVLVSLWRVQWKVVVRHGHSLGKSRRNKW